MYEFKTNPFEHQRTALRRTGLLGGTSPLPYFAFFMEMGTGKSKVAVDEAGILFARRLIDIFIVVAPKGVCNNWVKPGGELDVHLGVPYCAVRWQAGGGSATNQKELMRLLTPDPKVLRVLVVNVEAFSSGTKADVYMRKLLASGRAYMLVDESTTIKNPDAARTKKVVSYGQLAAYRRIASGSPVTRSPLDVYSQFEFLNPGLLGHRSFFSFRAKYAVMQEKNFGSRKAKIVVGYRNTEELAKMLEPHSYRVLKKDCLDLPEKIYTTWDVDLTDEQQRAYVSMRDEAFAEIGDHFASAQAAVTLIMRLQQIVCGHFTDELGNIQRLPSNRPTDLLEILESVRSDVIIWSHFRDDIARIVDAVRAEYGEASVAQFHGGNTNTRDADAERFLGDDRCRFMVATQSAGGRGNTWLNGTTVVYYSNSSDLEARLQSEDRPHRSGQKNPVTYIDMITPGTVQVKMLKGLKNKMTLAEMVMQDDPREWVI